VIEFKKGIHLLGTRLWLDSLDPQELCFVSHGHVDHLGMHSTVIASRPTSEFYRHRLCETNMIILDYGKPYKLDDMYVTMYPAGHILGSSQIVIEYKEKRILYSGDFKMKSSFTAEPIELTTADVLITEATYGLPQYLFPDRTVAIQQVVDLMEKALAEEKIPVILAYSLGKGQEITKILGDKGYELVVHKTIYDLVKLYEKFSVTFKNYEKFNTFDGTKGSKKIYILPPYLASSSMIRSRANKYVVLLSGWALGRTKITYPVDEIIPLSDHADFNELLEYVRAVNPKQVYVTHGTPEFVTYLQNAGYAASFLHS
jgi:Cft2 family RNA processing exonuclease